MQSMIQIETLRPLAFVIIISIVLFMQLKMPAFKNSLPKRKTTNTFLLLYSILLMRIFVPFTIIGILDVTSEVRPEYLRLDALSFYIQIPLVIIIFDFLIYWQHRFFHIFTPLWRLHKVHHSDTEMDFTTGFRFHPLEIIVSAVYKMFFLFLLWPTPEIYIVYEIILSSMAIYNHGNIKHTKSIDLFLRKLIVTPAMHFPHHDRSNRLMNRNYGNFLSIWDKLFKTYSLEDVHKFGVEDVNEKDSLDMNYSLLSPFKRKTKK